MNGKVLMRSEKAIYDQFFDIAGFFLRGLQGASTASLVSELAASIGQTLNKAVMILWQPAARGADAGSEGATWSVGSVRALEQPEIREVIEKTKTRFSHRENLHDIDLVIESAENNEWMGLIIARASLGPGRKIVELRRRLWILLAAPRGHTFLGHSLTWTLLYRMVVGYLDERRLSKELSLSAKIERLPFESAAPLETLGLAVEVLKPKSEEVDLQPAGKLLLAGLVQRFLSSAMDDSSAGVAEPGNDLAFIRDQLKLRDDATEESLLFASIEQWFIPGPKPPGLTKPPVSQSHLLALFWISRWTWFLRQSLPAEQGAAAWGGWLSEAVTDTSHLLKGWSVKPLPGKNTWSPGALAARYVSLWLRLWFCHGLLRQELEPIGADRPALSPTQRKRFRHDLAYVLRETLRAFVSDRSKDYRARPERLARALRTLIEYHAEQVAALPAAVDVRGRLEAMSRSFPAGGPELSARHLQHIFDVYITGQFFGSLKIGVAKEGRDLRSELAGGNGGGQLGGSELTRAFSLAALFHTMGDLLFPWWSRHAEKLGNPERGLREHLRQIADTLAGAAGDFAGRCLDDLKEGAYFDAGEQKAIEEWLDDKKRLAAEADAALLGAWYVHRAALGVKLPPEVRRQAVRAVLLNHMVTLPIDLKKDPVAALLTLCDELFAWDPRPLLDRSLGAGRWFLGSTTSSIAERFATLEVTDLEFKLQQQGKGKKAIMGFEARLKKRPPCLLPGFTLQATMREDPRAAVELWVGLRMSLGRLTLSRDPVAGNEKWIQVKTPVPISLEACGLSVRSLLEAVAQKAEPGLRTSLEAWFREGQTAEESQASGESETLILKLQTNPFCREEPTLLLEEFERLVQIVVQEHRAIRR